MTFQEDLIDILTNEIEQLRVDINKAFIDGAADERAKIVALLHEHLSDWCKAETESGDIKYQYHQGSDALERLLWAIEEGSI